MRSNGLKTKPWCTPILISNSLLYETLTLTLLFASLYIAWTKTIIHSGTPTTGIAHPSTLCWTLSKVFSRSMKAKERFLFLSKNFSWSCLTMKIASVDPCPDIKPNCISSMTMHSLMIFLITLSGTFLLFYLSISYHGNSLCLMFHFSGTFPSLTTGLMRQWDQKNWQSCVSSALWCSKPNLFFNMLLGTSLTLNQIHWIIPSMVFRVWLSGPWFVIHNEVWIFMTEFFDFMGLFMTFKKKWKSLDLSVGLWHWNNTKVILTLWTLNYVDRLPFSCIDFFHIIHNWVN